MLRGAAAVRRTSDRRRRRRYQLTTAELVHTPFAQSIHANEAADAADAEFKDVIEVICRIEVL